MSLSDEELVEMGAAFEGVPAPMILWWAVSRFPGRIAVTSSFQSQSVPLLHLVGRLCPRVPVLFLDTGFHFPETLEFKDHLAGGFGLNVEVVTAVVGHDDQERRTPDLWKRDPGMCCYLNKVEPLERALEERDAWITGLRRDQTPQRRTAPILSRDRNGRVKICPLVNWTSETVSRYMHAYDLPSHPLHDQGFKSIGCAPCTRAVAPGESDRSGRWAESDKTECGLHYDESGVIVRSNKN